MKVVPIPTREAKPWILKKHYAHRMPGSIIFAFGLFIDHNLCGVITFGMSPNYHNNKVGDYDCFELNRMVLSCPKLPNAGSWFLGRVFRLLPTPVALISYADEGMHHYGFIYQATNWIYTGTSKGAELYELNDGQIISKRALDQQLDNKTRVIGDIKSRIRKTIKHRYFMFLGNKRDRKAMRKALRYDEQPYPKGETKRYDASAEFTTQPLLFE